MICFRIPKKQPKNDNVMGVAVLYSAQPINLLQIKNCTFIQKFFSFLPVRHQHRQKVIEVFGMIGVDEVAKLMHYHIFDAVSGCFQKSLVKRDDTFAWQAGPPSCIHCSDS